ncbi:hypothetical protein [uncultured Methanoregula sp.]|uniref:hypothetical protein n=1 Tax=uncultured Methanoregula sp. TaxID=1005933 RepID=UPI002AAB9804|nr:hypothetical protein [uncultured Methanoregula sp.]
MGICTDIMHDFVLQEIHRLYSSVDGWKITQKKKGIGYDTIVIAGRMNQGHREIVRILVTFKKEVTLDMIDELIRPEPVFDGTTPRYDYAVIVPANADTSQLPKDLKIYIMRSFAFDGKELVWVKKPVMETS